MTLYDLLRKMIAGGAWTEKEIAAAEDLLHQLQAVSVFGAEADTLVTAGNNG